MTEQKNTSHPQFMIIDDNMEDLYLTNYLIEKWSKSSFVDQFDSAFKALEFLKNNTETIELIPDIILLDLNMPTMNGFQFMEELAKLDAPIRSKSSIYMLSSSTDLEEVSKAVNHSSIKMFIEKPLNKEKFNVILQNYFELNNSEKVMVKSMNQ